MNKKSVALVVVALLFNVAVVVTAFGYLQNEINQLKIEGQKESTSPEASDSASPETSEEPDEFEQPETLQEPDAPQTSLTPQGTGSDQYSSVVYEWYLKPEYLNNVTWLNWTMATETQDSQIISTHYVSSKNWSENYVSHLKGYLFVPDFVKESGMGVLAGAAFVQNVLLPVSFDQTTGYTIIECDNQESLTSQIESRITGLPDAKGYTKTIH